MNTAVQTHDTNAFSTLDRFLRTRLLAQLDALRGGEIELIDELGSERVGEALPGAVPVGIRVHDPAFYRGLAGNGSVGAAETYMDGAWDCSNLVALVQLLVRNRDLLDGMERGPARLGSWAMKAWSALRRNTRVGARRNIAAHYDLGNAFFRLFLSDDLMYSSALYANAEDSLEQASARKLSRICEKLRLSADDHVVEIGTGWGGFAVFAASNYGCRVTTTTISKEQHALACERVAKAGLQDLVTVLLSDYRDLQGQYDKLVSIEMVEAIGPQYLDTYFATLGRLIKPEGLGLVQAITIEDHRYEQALRSVDFIKRHIFPGSFIPSIAAMLTAKARSTDLALLHLEDFGPSYARTLHAWRERFLGNREEVRAQGFDERFIRMWDFYMAYCEGGFLERSIGVAHLLLAKPGHRGDSYLPGSLDA